MNNKPRLTVVTPNYNGGYHLEQAICSALDQGYDNLEYFVIDGGSSDDSVDIIRHYEGQLAGWVSEPDQGIADAINKGLDRATGDFVAFLPSDSLLLPGALEEVAKRVSASDQPQWVVGRCDRISTDNQITPSTPARAPRSLASFLMHDSGLLPTQASFWSRRFIDAYGPLDKHLRFAFGYEYACRLMARGHAPVVTHYALSARYEHQGWHSACDILQQGLEYITAANRYAPNLSFTQRCALWFNCDTRRRIYTLAQAEMHNKNSRRFIWQKLLSRPWWITSEAVRHALLHGVTHTLPSRQTAMRPAA